MKHATPYEVAVTTYSLEQNEVGKPLATIYLSRHRTPKAAARRLAELINGKTALARRHRPQHANGRYSIRIHGTIACRELALRPFRQEFITENYCK